MYRDGVGNGNVGLGGVGLGGGVYGGTTGGYERADGIEFDLGNMNHRRSDMDNWRSWE